MDWTDEATPYLKRVAERVLPLSREKRDLRKALNEWRYTGSVRDLEEPCEDCEFCGYKGIRYQFEIENRLTNHSLEIGSECIIRFQVPVYSGDRQVRDEKRIKSILEADQRKELERMRHQRLREALQALAAEEVGLKDMIQGILENYETEDALTPKQAATLQWRFSKHRSIRFKVEWMKLRLRKKAHFEQLLEMEDWKLQKLMPALSDAQQKKLAEYRNDL